MWGALAALALAIVFGGLLLGRWWQSLLQRARAVRHRVPEAAARARRWAWRSRRCSCAAFAVDSPLLSSLAWVAFAALAFQGLAAAHRSKAGGRLNRGWLAAIYVLLIVPLSTSVTVLYSRSGDSRTIGCGPGRRTSESQCRSSVLHRVSMEIILLQKVANLGNIGDRVKVKSGYGRNFLLPQGKATLATADNIAKFEARRAEFEKTAREELSGAQARAAKLEGFKLTLTAKAGSEGKLFGSIGTSDIAEALNKAGHEIERSEVRLPHGPIRQAGEHVVQLHLHTDLPSICRS